MKGSSVNSCLHLLSSYQASPRAFPVENETELPLPFVKGKALGTRLSSHTIMGQSDSAGGCSKMTMSAQQKFSFSGRSAGSLQSFLNQSGDLVSSILGYFVQFIVAAPDLASTLAREIWERRGGRGGSVGRRHSKVQSNLHADHHS